MESMFVTRIQLYFRGERLKGCDTFSKSDPYCVVYHDNGDNLAEAGRTNTQHSTQDPVFTQCITVNYHFEQRQNFLIKVIDDDGKSDAENDLMGTARFQLSHVVGARNATLALNMNPGTLYVTALEISAGGHDTVELSFAGRGLKKANPYFKLFLLHPNGLEIPAYQSPPMKNTCDPVWPTVPTLKASELCCGDRTSPSVIFKCYSDGVLFDSFMGSFTVSLQQLLNATGGAQSFTLRHPKKNTEAPGSIVVSRAICTHVPTLLEFLKGGMQINLAMSIDFTCSNGDPRQTYSLHHMNPTQPNQYIRAMVGVGDILVEYDTNKMLPSFGFGAQLEGVGVSHLFNLSLTEDPFVPGVQGVLNSYGQCLSRIRLSGPTNLAPTIAAVERMARSRPGVYTVLLILTDGEVTDKCKTIPALASCDDAPLSIIIVGIGKASKFDWLSEVEKQGAAKKFQYRDCCCCCGKKHTRTIRRNMVRFLPFSKVECASREALAAEVLRDLPDQFVEWTRLVNVSPAVPLAQK